MISKCFKVCGCSSNNVCQYCNLTDYVGYDIQNSKNPSLTLPPNTNNLQCSINTEYVDVSICDLKMIFLILKLEKLFFLNSVSKNVDAHKAVNVIIVMEAISMDMIYTIAV